MIVYDDDDGDGDDDDDDDDDDDENDFFCSASPDSVLLTSKEVIMVIKTIHISLLPWFQNGILVHITVKQSMILY